MYMLLAKSQEFDFNTMNARVEIAVLDHSNNVHRKQDLLKKKEEAVGGKTTSNGIFLPVNYLRTGLRDKLWNPNHAVLLMI